MRLPDNIRLLPFFPLSAAISFNNRLRRHNKSGKIILCPVCGSRTSRFLKKREVLHKYFAMYDSRKAASLYYCKGDIGRGMRLFAKRFFAVEWRLCNRCGNAYQNFPHTEKSLMRYYEEFSERSQVCNVSKSFFKIKSLSAAYFIKRSGLNPSARILDVGSAIGIACKYFSDAGYEAWGIEPSEWRVTFAKDSLGLKNIVKDLYNKESFDADFFDGIISHHVLEHILNPESFFEALAKHIKPGGMLLLQLPSLEEDRTATMPADHLIAYSIRGIKYLLDRYGFKVFEELVVPKKLSNVPAEWRIKGDMDFEEWTVQGIQPGAMSVLAQLR